MNQLKLKLLVLFFGYVSLSSCEENFFTEYNITLDSVVVIDTIQVFDTIAVSNVHDLDTLFQSDPINVNEPDPVEVIDPGDIITLPTEIPLGSFHAWYYREEDGNSTGTGTDGLDPSIVRELIATEIVPRPTINYAWNDLHNIDSYNFYGVWQGTIQIKDEEVINANFDVSWSDVAFFVDDKLYDRWSNSNKVIPLSLSSGTHEIRVEYHNHWHTTGFNTSFTNYTSQTISEVSTWLPTTIDGNDEIVFVGCYESDSRFNDVQVYLPDNGHSYFVFLASYNALNWIISKPENTRISGIVFRSFAPGSFISGVTEVPVFEVTDLRYDYDTFEESRVDIRAMTGRSPDIEIGDYSIVSAIIPE